VKQRYFQTAAKYELGSIAVSVLLNTKKYASTQQQTLKLYLHRERNSILVKGKDCEVEADKSVPSHLIYIH